MKKLKAFFAAHNNMYLAAGWTGLFLLCFLLTWSFGIGAALSCVATFVAATAHSRYTKGLVERTAVQNSPTWDVQLNSVRVGSVSDADYAAIRLRIFQDVRLYIAQALNIGRVVLSTLDLTLRVIPVLAFWAVVGVAFMAPDLLLEFVMAWRAATAADITHAIPKYAFLLACTWNVIWLSMVMTGSRMGFINRFDEAINTQLRVKLGTPAEGDFVLTRTTPAGVKIFNNEIAHLSASKGV